MMEDFRHRQSTANRKARRRARGALAVEGMIVIIMTTGILIGTFYMRKVYSGKLLTITSSRADAWKLALSGCDSGNQEQLYGDIHEQSKNKDAKICQNPKDCSGSTADGLADDGASPPPPWFPNATTGESSKSLTVNSDTYSTTLTTMHKFSCNEKPAKELQLGSLDLLSQVADVAKKIVDEEVDEDTSAKTCWQKYGVPIKWHQMNCQTDSLFKNGGDPAGLYTQRRDLNVPVPDNSKN